MRNRYNPGPCCCVHGTTVPATIVQYWESEEFSQQWIAPVAFPDRHLQIHPPIGFATQDIVKAVSFSFNPADLPSTYSDVRLTFYGLGGTLEALQNYVVYGIRPNPGFIQLDGSDYLPTSYTWDDSGTTWGTGRSRTIPHNLLPTVSEFLTHPNFTGTEAPTFMLVPVNPSSPIDLSQWREVEHHLSSNPPEFTVT